MSQEELVARNDLVSTMKERIEAIPDGTLTSINGAKPIGDNNYWTTASTSYKGVKFDTTSGN